MNSTFLRMSHYRKYTRHYLCALWPRNIYVHHVLLLPQISHHVVHLHPIQSGLCLAVHLLHQLLLDYGPKVAARFSLKGLAVATGGVPELVYGFREEEGV